jgi:hypothetical protein
LDTRLSFSFAAERNRKTSAFAILVSFLSN